MKHLFLFNPENDIALGLGLPHITPPRQATLLHKAGAMLPFWLGNINDSILVNSCDIVKANEWRNELIANTGISGPTPISQVNTNENYSLLPWGWSFDAISQFKKFGIEDNAFAHLQEIMPTRRALSHRRTALRFLTQWSNKISPLNFPLPIETKSPEEVTKYLSDNGSSILKSPWSSSGRGVFPITNSTLLSSLPRINGIIKNQGSIIVEPLLPKIQDFAMLFNYSNGSAHFAGYSLFFNSTSTNYGGNFVASDESILKRLSQWITPYKIEETKNLVSETLAEVLGDNYNGPLGVDMMICGEDGNAWLNPCIEINLRYTMGFIAKGVFTKLGTEGVMSISPTNDRQLSNKKEGDKSIRLVPKNDWFDFIFYSNL